MNLIDDDKIFKINEECKYVVTMIDDYNQYTIIYLLKWKFNLMRKLWNYLKFMKIQSTSIQQLHLNNEDEYVDYQIIKLFKKHKIK